jgi:DMSO/TMAO reductase YedYZ heme-binding membrane subunit
MTLFGRGHGVTAACRPAARVIQVPVRRRAIPALSAAGANQPRGRHRAPIAVLLAGKTGPLAASGTPAGIIIPSLQRFLLAYSGVFALVALTAAVAAGLAATDRLVVSPAGRVICQAVHRALSLAALGFLASHVLLEVLARRSHAVDAVVPFLATGRTLYLGLGTLAADLILLIAITGVARRQFAARWTAAWRGVHVTAYLAWPLAILHGLLGGRTAKPYVDWSYGACVAAVAVALVVRLVAPRRTRTLLASAPPPRPRAGPDPAPGPAAPGLPVYLSAPVQPGGYLPAPPPAHPALPAGGHDGGTQYGVVYGIVDDGVPRTPETP